MKKISFHFLEITKATVSFDIEVPNKIEKGITRTQPKKRKSPSHI